MLRIEYGMSGQCIFTQPLACENTAHEHNTCIFHSQPWNDVPVPSSCIEL